MQLDPKASYYIVVNGESPLPCHKQGGAYRSQILQASY
jgi:hypothetical protein